MGGAECSQGWQEEFLRVNYIKACLHANGNNQIMEEKLMMEKTNCVISGEWRVHPM